jgi:hypothetical protein
MQHSFDLRAASRQALIDSGFVADAPADVTTEVAAMKDVAADAAA